MEHNIEKLLQSKILLEERKPIAWRKEATWERIQTEVVGGRKIAYVYYAYAAACVLIAAMFLYGFSRRNERLMDERIHAAAICIDELKITLPATETLAIANNVLNECTPTPKLTLPDSKNHDKHHWPMTVTPMEASEPVVAELELVREIDAQSPVATTGDLPSGTAETARTSAIQKVRPIIGIVIGKTPEPLIADKKKNNKIKFFPREKDASALDVPEPTTLTARIN